MAAIASFMSSHTVMSCHVFMHWVFVRTQQGSNNRLSPGRQWREQQRSTLQKKHRAGPLGCALCPRLPKMQTCVPYPRQYLLPACSRKDKKQSWASLSYGHFNSISPASPAAASAHSSRFAPKKKSSIRNMLCNCFLL